jgi:hypothetical protein
VAYRVQHVCNNTATDRNKPPHTRNRAQQTSNTAQQSRNDRNIHVRLRNPYPSLLRAARPLARLAPEDFLETDYMTYHELFGFMSPALAKQVLDDAYNDDKTLYKMTLAAVANAKKLRPAFYEKKARVDRDADMLSMLARPRLEEAGATLLRGWLMKKQTPLLVDFLDALGLKHKNGVVDDFPATLDDATLKKAIDALLAKYPKEIVIVYLNAFGNMNEAGWANLNEMLEKDERLQLA